MTKEIKLTKGYVALVDDEDYNYLNQWKWAVSKRKNTIYAQGVINNKPNHMHRFIIKPKKNQIIDHINGNGLDNRKSNLRICTQSENLRNRSKPKWKKTTSKYKGVSFVKNRKTPWRSYIQINKKYKHLGHFNNEIDAAIAYNKAAIKYYKKFAFLNEIKNEN